MKAKKFVSIFIALCLLCGFSACGAKPVEREVPTYTVEFLAMPGGRIEGNRLQTVKEGENAEKVVAIANPGYYFYQWIDDDVPNSDQTVMRSEIIVEDVRKNTYIMAIFERRTQPLDGEVFEYTLNYKYADENCDEKTVSLTHGHTENTVLPVPSRANAKFGGWYGDTLLTKQVSDENGNLLAGDALLEEGGSQLYAKWIAENTRPYKILMVYVTEVEAELMKKDNSGKVPIHYIMSDLERQICHMITTRFAFTLNDLAVANFCVDEYFTTEPITEVTVSTGDGIVSHFLDPEDISEIQGMFADYDCIMLTYCFGDYTGNFDTSNIRGRELFARVSFEVAVRNLVVGRGKPLDVLLDPYCFYWEQLVDDYMMAFCYTVERKVANVIEYDKVWVAYLRISNKTGIDFPYNYTEEVYLLNKAEVDGETVGVPYEYWQGKVATVHYAVKGDGYIGPAQQHSKHIVYGQREYNDYIQYVTYGKNAIEVKAIPFTGSVFVGWSDGVTSNIRQEKNLNGDFKAYAIFEKQ